MISGGWGLLDSFRMGLVAREANHGIRGLEVSALPPEKGLEVELIRFINGQ